MERHTHSNCAGFHNKMQTVIFFLLTILATVNCGAENGVIAVARCRYMCIARFLKHVENDAKTDEKCKESTSCVSCWDTCKYIYIGPDVWKGYCRKKLICKDGCQAACKFRRSRTKVKQNYDTWTFKETPAVNVGLHQKAYVAWSKPVMKNSNPDSSFSRTAPKFVYVLLSKDMSLKKGSAWLQILQTSKTSVALDTKSLPYDPEFWLLAVSENGTETGTRFKAPEPLVPIYDKATIHIDTKFQEGNGPRIEYTTDSTLKVTYTQELLDGQLSPTLEWTNPSIKTNSNEVLEYSVDVFLQSCACDLPPEHFPYSVAVEPYEKPAVTLKHVAFNAGYLVEIMLLSDQRWWAKLKIKTQTCTNMEQSEPYRCMGDVILVSPSTVSTRTTPSPKATIMFESVMNSTIPIKSDHTDHLIDSLDTHDFIPDWNITKVGMEYVLGSQKVFLHLKWSVPFNHSRAKYQVVYTNIDHGNHVDASMVQARGKMADTTTETLELRNNSLYSIFVEAIITDENGKTIPRKSRSLLVNTTITDDTPQISQSRMKSLDHEKDILNGIILGVTAVASLIILSIISLIVYKKRLCFRDITITKTTVAKSNSYKSNVGCKGDYSNQILISNDDWEIDCRQLKFASHIGQGAFGKVVTGYYNDERVAIKLVRDCAPLSYKEDLLAEINLMKRLGSHPNIVSMIGACTLVEPICLVMEYVPYGNLQNFLKKCRLEGELTNQTGRSPELNYSIMDEHGGMNEGVITPANLLSFARQVSMAMEYLAEKKYVHRDLAARNVLLGFNKIIKVCDFGLSRDIFTDNQYKKLTNGKLPLKWMAIESLRDRLFTTQSDVWSFGILLWEIVTMGASPYPNIALADLYYLLSNNYRMEKPSNCSDEVYIIMRQCWLENPTDRPNFTDLRVQLELLLTRDRNYLELDNINVPLSTPESSSGSPASDDTKSLLAAQALQPQRKSSKDELTVNVSIHDKSVERLLKRKGDFDLHNVTIL